MVSPKKSESENQSELQEEQSKSSPDIRSFEYVPNCLVPSDKAYTLNLGEADIANLGVLDMKVTRKINKPMQNTLKPFVKKLKWFKKKK